MRKKNKK